MKKISLLLLATLILGGCSKNTTLNKFSNTSLTSGFDTVISLIGYTSTQEKFDEYFAFTDSEFKRYNALFDKYNDYEGINNIKTINDNAGIKPIKVDKDIIEMIELAKQFSGISHNQFDITMGPVLEIWHHYREQGMIQNVNNEPTTIPSTEELSEAQACTGWDKVDIDEANSTIYLNQSCASLDVGSIAKGFATEKIALELTEKGLTNGILNAGGNVRAINEKPDGPWVAGIQNPDLSGQGGSIATLTLSGKQSLVTSGDYQRYYLYEGDVMHHIIDPATLFPAKHVRALSVITDHSGIADICSTLLYTMTYEEANTMIAKIKDLGYTLSVIWIFDETDVIPEGVEKIEHQNYTIVTTDDLIGKLKIQL